MTPKRKTAKTEPPAAGIRDRIVELRRVPASELLRNPRNWRTHPKAQQEAMQGILEEVGCADAFIGRITESGEIELIDGHMRAELMADQEVPVLILDVTETEADKILLTHDPIGAMAQASTEKLEALMGLSIESQAAKEMLEQLASQHQLFADKDGEADAPESAASEESEKLKAFIAKRQASVERGKDKSEVNFWVCLVFQSWLQKQEFLAAITDVPVLYGMYADGEQFAKRVGVEVTANQQTPIQSPLDKKLSALVILNQESVA